MKEFPTPRDKIYYDMGHFRGYLVGVIVASSVQILLVLVVVAIQWLAKH